jgi:hypothetical protein
MSGEDMTFHRGRAERSKKAPQVHLGAIPRSAAPALDDVEQAIEVDRRWFAEHPEDEYIREFVPGEFAAKELPPIPSGFRYATLVTVIHRTDGVADGRHRQMIAVAGR